MDSHTHQISYRLGRRPGEKGPRTLPSNQDRIEKLDTGSRDTEIEKVEEMKKKRYNYGIHYIKGRGM